MRLKCSKCRDILSPDEFHMTSRKYGEKVYKYRRSDCKECRAKVRRLYYLKQRGRLGETRNEAERRSNQRTSTRGGLVR